MRRTIIAAVLTVLVLPAAAGAQNFGRMFPGLPALPAVPDQQLIDLSLSEQDPNLDADNNPAGKASGDTYFGQAVDHDLTRDECCPVPAPTDPTTIPNARTFRLDLDDVYGNGPALSPQLYEADGAHLRVQEDNGNGVRDLPRNPDGSAVIGDSRNDENEIVSQLHVALLKFHNAVLDETCKKVTAGCFEKAQAETQHYYQWVIVHEFLPTIVGQATVDRFLAKDGKVKCEFFCAATFTPVEFSVAAYRLHTMVRLAYEVNETTGKIQVFNAAGNDLHGGRPIPAGRQIAWGNFVNALTEPDDADGVNLFRKIDVLVSKSLYNLLIPGAEPAGAKNLPFRNLIRGQAYGLPSYESVAQAMGVTPVDTGAQAFGFTAGTPLWYGIFAESGQQGGQIMGPVGGRIVAETLLRVLADDKTSILSTGWKPKKPFTDVKGTFGLADLLVDAGVAVRPA